MSSLKPGNSQALPADVQAALTRGDMVEAMRLLREHVAVAVEALNVQATPEGEPPPASTATSSREAGVIAEVAAAFARGDEAEATRLLRQAVERQLGKPAHPASGLSPGSGRQPSSGLSDYLLWVALLCMLGAAVYHWVAG